MLHLIPAGLHRRLYRVADWGRNKLWRIRKPRRGSVVVLIYDDARRVLLVRHSYGPALWMLPGGGLGRTEDPETAAHREMAEELKCGITDLLPLRPGDQTVPPPSPRLHLYSARLVGSPEPDMREIVAVGLFDPLDLPRNVGRMTRRHIETWRLQQA